MDEATVIACARVAWKRVMDLWTCIQSLPSTASDFMGQLLEAILILERIKLLSPATDWIALGIHIPADR